MPASNLEACPVPFERPLCGDRAERPQRCTIHPCLQPRTRSRRSRAGTHATRRCREREAGKIAGGHAPMKTLQRLFDSNREWAARIQRQDPEFFSKLSRQQSPEYLWIGCSDSRVPANDIVGLLPGELFVHRNVANVVVHTDLNCLSVIQFAVELLKVKHIIVCGHYGCSGVEATLRGDRLGLSDNWLRHVQDVREKHAASLATSRDFARRSARLCELNVIEQVVNVGQTSILRDAWERGQDLTLHGWVYGLQDGLLRDLNTTITPQDSVLETYKAAIAALPGIDT